MHRFVLALVLCSVSAWAQSSTLDCQGEEPFWRVRAGATSATVNRPGPQKPAEETYRGALKTFDFLSPMWAVFRGASTRRSRNQLFLAVREESCQSTMSEEGGPFTHRAVVSFPDGVQAPGCCRVTTQVSQLSAKPEADWARFIPDLLPVMRRCLSDAKPDAVSVLRAWPMNRGKAGVRLAGATGSAVDCVTDITGVGQLEVQNVTPSSSTPPGVGSPTFYPERSRPPTGVGRLEELLDEKGARVGWLLYPAQ